MPTIELPALAQACATGSEVTSTRRYHLGTLETCPWQHLTLAGQSFPRFSARLIQSEITGVMEPSDPRPGIEVDLTADQVARIEDVLSRTVVRGFGSRRPQRVTVVSLDQVVRGDVPIAEHLYFRPVDDAPAEAPEVRSWLAAAQAQEAAAVKAEEKADREERRKSKRR